MDEDRPGVLVAVAAGLHEPSVIPSFALAIAWCAAAGHQPPDAGRQYSVDVPERVVREDCGREIPEWAWRRRGCSGSRGRSSARARPQRLHAIEHRLPPGDAARGHLLPHQRVDLHFPRGRRARGGRTPKCCGALESQMLMSALGSVSLLAVPRMHAS